MNDPCFEPLPSDFSRHIDRLARDLAWGFLNNQWNNAFYIQGIPEYGDLKFASDWNHDLETYLKEVWNNQPPNPAQLVDLDYVEKVQGVGDNTFLYKLTDKGLQLARRAKTAPIFISYCRFESTPFAILLSDRLKANGLAPFLDNQSDKDDQGISLKPGGKWLSDLKSAIEARDYFVILVAPTTLNSEVVCQELEWALASHKKVIPIWHRGFDLKNSNHFPINTLPLTIQEAITGTNAIQVYAEDPNQYENAIEKFLSLFR
ncbi:MAG TPA: toll/interleukin-1 receptor domain-containing protein [Phototrophicaceae bacterium]|nr:toll/interleukin-1 receptor domain-containing protein [Phototrophicaceae bacterium]